MRGEANVEVVRRIYEDGLFDLDHERLLALTAPEVEARHELRELYDAGDAVVALR
jgi:hypothetical protein